MINQFELKAQPRDAQGKGASRRLRRVGQLPAIVYGGGKDPVCIQLEHNAMLLQTEHEAFYSHILTLKLPAGDEKVVVKDMQRHPVRPIIMHMDFQRINEAEEITIRVPIHFLNEDKCVGVKQSGGVINHEISDLEVMCLPKDLPEYIEVDLANLDVGDIVHLANLEMPPGVRIASFVHGGDTSLPVVAVHAPRVAEEPAAGEGGAAPAA